MNIGTEQSHLHFFIAKTERAVAAWFAVLPFAVLAFCCGCSGGPSALPVPGYDPAGSARKAMELYDQDGDGFVADEELKSAPGLRAAMATLDTDKDGKVSEEEISDRLLAWEKMRIGMMMFSCTTLLNGKPLHDAIITFDPDGFLEGTIKPAVGHTSLGGTTMPKVPKEDRPGPNSPPGIQAGIYKVRISKMVDGQETIPAKYNTETILGQEVSSEDPAISNNRVVYKLKKQGDHSRERN